MEVDPPMEMDEQMIMQDNMLDKNKLNEQLNKKRDGKRGRMDPDYKNEPSLEL